MAVMRLVKDSSTGAPVAISVPVHFMSTPVYAQVSHRRVQAKCKRSRIEKVVEKLKSSGNKSGVR